jgi:hypothetical protein
MRTAVPRLSLLCIVALLVGSTSLSAQATTGSILGTVRDNQEAVVPGATVTIRNVETNAVRTVVSDGSGSYRFLNVPVGAYELSVELSGFSKYSRAGITLSLNQDAVVDVQIQPAGLAETVTVTADAPLLNTTTNEVGVRFDTTRVAELPVQGATFRDVFALALSAPGVSQLGSGQSGFASGTNFSSNGMRVRSNNFMIDGQDSNDPSVTGRQQPINNTDIIQEVRLITNQFAAEYGRAAGSIVNAATKSGTNQFRGSAFAFHNDQSLNSRNNLDSKIRDDAPPRKENQFGGTLGGPISPGVTTATAAVFAGTETGRIALPTAFKPLLGCIPGGGGSRGRTMRPPTRSLTSAAAERGDPVVRRVKSFRLRAGRTTTATHRCQSDERLVSYAHAVAFHMKRAPTARQLSQVESRATVSGGRIRVTGRAGPLVGGLPVRVQVQAVCARPNP